MNVYSKFFFKNYSFDKETKKLIFTYSIDDTLTFTETYMFNFEFVEYDRNLLDRALQGLFFMAGVSYYKTYLPAEIVIQKGDVDLDLADFLSKTYSRGLGEFFYVNKLDPRTKINFPINSKILDTLLTKNSSGYLVGLGGGKDSLVSIEILRDTDGIATWTLNHTSQLQPLVNKINLPHFQVERTWDTQLLELNKRGAYNGHVPISAIFAFVGVIVAILSGKRDVVVSNEHAANEQNLIYQGVAINHQYSKSQEFETDFQNYLSKMYGDSLRYYSTLRPFSELAIAKYFSTIFDKYKEQFSSCNRAFTHNSNRVFWCGECAKCAFTFLILTPFVDRIQLEKLWGKNLLLDHELEQTYQEILGIHGSKPLDCVGEIAESRFAMKLAQEIYPELEKYSFDLDNFNPAKLHKHSMPGEIFEQFSSELV